MLAVSAVLNEAMPKTIARTVETAVTNIVVFIELKLLFVSEWLLLI